MGRAGLTRVTKKFGLDLKTIILLSICRLGTVFFLFLWDRFNAGAREYHLENSYSSLENYILHQERVIYAGIAFRSWCVQQILQAFFFEIIQIHLTRYWQTSESLLQNLNAVPWNFYMIYFICLLGEDLATSDQYLCRKFEVCWRDKLGFCSYWNKILKLIACCDWGVVEKSIKISERASRTANI